MSLDLAQSYLIGWTGLGAGIAAGWAFWRWATRKPEPVSLQTLIDRDRARRREGQGA